MTLVDNQIVFDVQKGIKAHAKECGMTLGQFRSAFIAQYGVSFDDYKFEKLVLCYQKECLSKEYGLTTKEFAEKYTVGQSVVAEVGRFVTGRQRKKTVSIKATCVRMAEMGMRKTDIAEYLGLHKNSVTDIVGHISTNRSNGRTKRIVELYNSGKTICEISKIMSIGREAVIFHLETEGVDVKNYLSRFDESVKRGIAEMVVSDEYTIDDIRNKYGLSIYEYSRVVRILGLSGVRNRNRWKKATDKTLGIIRPYIMDGLTERDVADKSGYSIRMVNHVVNKYGDEEMKKKFQENKTKKINN